MNIYSLYEVKKYYWLLSHGKVPVTSSVNKIGCLYQVKKFNWLLYPSKEIADTVERHSPEDLDGTNSTAVAAHYSKLFNCNVSYTSPKDLVVLLEADKNYKKVLSAKGEIGWIRLPEIYNNCFEEVNTK